MGVTILIHIMNFEVKVKKPESSGDRKMKVDKGYINTQLFLFQLVLK